MVISGRIRRNVLNTSPPAWSVTMPAPDYVLPFLGVREFHSMMSGSVTLLTGSSTGLSKDSLFRGLIPIYPTTGSTKHLAAVSLAIEEVCGKVLNG